MSERKTNFAAFEADAEAAVKQTQDDRYNAMGEDHMDLRLTKEISAEKAQRLNDQVQIMIWGSGDRKVTIGTQEYTPDQPFPGRLETFRNAPGGTYKERHDKANSYEADVLELVENQGYELCQAKLIMDLREEEVLADFGGGEALTDGLKTHMLKQFMRSGASMQEAKQRVAERYEGMTNEDVLKEVIKNKAILDEEELEAVLGMTSDEVTEPAEPSPETAEAGETDGDSPKSTTVVTQAPVELESSSMYAGIKRSPEELAALRAVDVARKNGDGDGEAEARRALSAAIKTIPEADRAAQNDDGLKATDVLHKKSGVKKLKNNRQNSTKVTGASGAEAATSMGSAEDVSEEGKDDNDVVHKKVRARRLGRFVARAMNWLKKPTVISEKESQSPFVDVEIPVDASYPPVPSPENGVVEAPDNEPTASMTAEERDNDARVLRSRELTKRALSKMEDPEKRKNAEESLKLLDTMKEKIEAELGGFEGTKDSYDKDFNGLRAQAKRKLLIARIQNALLLTSEKNELMAKVDAAIPEDNDFKYNPSRLTGNRTEQATVNSDVTTQDQEKVNNMINPNVDGIIDLIVGLEASGNKAYAEDEYQKSLDLLESVYADRPDKIEEFKLRLSDARSRYN